MEKTTKKKRTLFGDGRFWLYYRSIRKIKVTEPWQIFFRENYKEWKSSRNGSSLMIFEIRSMIFECFDHARHVPDVRTSKSSYFRRKMRGHLFDFSLKNCKKLKCSRNGSWCIENQHKLVQTGSKFREKANREVKKITGCVSEQF